MVQVVDLMPREAWHRQPKESQGLTKRPNPGAGEKRSRAARLAQPPPAVPGDQNGSQQRHRPTGLDSRSAGAWRNPFQGPLSSEQRKA